MAVKKGVIDMGDYMYSTKEFEAYRWCVENGIYISPVAKSTLEWHLSIEMNKKIHISPDTYKKVDVWKQLFKFDMYYYDKYKK